MMKSFPYLPFEIREIIYGLSLVADAVILPYENARKARISVGSSREKSNLSMGILSTNHEISKKAKAVFYGQNIWMFSNPMRFCGGGMAEDQLKELWKANAKYLRHVEVSFDSKDVHPMDLCEGEDEIASYESRKKKPSRRGQPGHDEHRIYLAVAWA